ncbi:Lin1244/Lin1753 domain-containing protein [Bacteroides sp. 519]|uniref:Lin1244/Lin1753 domain-containing protein n=1 Tax=Bacteroides sp. 519 TaxID=2302937 RepID=UPI0013D2665E|nr:Lin1244/Lin1753 domain-containing protein [Bacteroides sp. 519]NDV57292.1 DUF4373 domain-containing protein [Bacteroides sp. 519]
MKTYLPLECGINNSNSMSALINAMGAKGYGIYMLLLLELRRHKNYMINNETLKLIARTYSIRRRLIDDVLYNYGLFIVETLPNGELCVRSEYVTRVMKNYDDKVAKSQIDEKKDADNECQTKSNVRYNDPITKEKNRKEKKTSTEKEKEKETAAVDAVVENKPANKTGLLKLTKQQRVSVKRHVRKAEEDIQNTS